MELVADALGVTLFAAVRATDQFGIAIWNKLNVDKVLENVVKVAQLIDQVALGVGALCLVVDANLYLGRGRGRVCADAILFL